MLDWALGCLGGKKYEAKKGRDRGIDGRIRFYDDPEAKPKQIIVSVKAGVPTVSHVRELQAVVAREKAEIGVLVVLNKITRDMRDEALGSGAYKSPWGNHRKIQIITALDIVGGKKIDCPPIFREDVTKRKKVERADIDAARRQKIL